MGDKTRKKSKCCCGHVDKQHTTYSNGTNRKGSQYVCTVSNCLGWNSCDIGTHSTAKKCRAIGCNRKTRSRHGYCFQHWEMATDDELIKAILEKKEWGKQFS